MIFISVCLWGWRCVTRKMIYSEQRERDFVKWSIEPPGISLPKLSNCGNEHSIRMMYIINSTPQRRNNATMNCIKMYDYAWFWLCYHSGIFHSIYKMLNNYYWTIWNWNRMKINIRIKYQKYLVTWWISIYYNENYLCDIWCIVYWIRVPIDEQQQQQQQYGFLG